jgi:subtilisin family serine protease
MSIAGLHPIANVKLGADINMEAAWDCETGDTNVVIAIIDSGCDIDNQELDDRIWTNWNEIPNDSIDNDGNGYIDDRNGWNFNGRNKIVTDNHGHGTSIASVAGAESNNNIGFAGVDWNCKIMPVKILEELNNIVSVGQLDSAIRYAVDMKADVINFSITFGSPSQTILNAIDYADSSGVVFVCISGNDGALVDLYPGKFKSNGVNILVVGATDPNDEHSSFSNSTTFLHVVAPGNYIYHLNHQDDTDFTTWNYGTSLSAGYVSGLASLLKAQDTSRSGATIIQIIKATAADEIGNFFDTPGFDIYYGHGRINAEKALCIGNPIAEVNANNIRLVAYPNPTSGKVTFEYQDIRFRRCKLEIYNGTGQLVVAEKIKGAGQLDVHLPASSGIYFYKADFDGKYFATGQLVKQ